MSQPDALQRRTSSPTMTMKEEKRGTAMVTPDKHNEYIKPMLPKKMHTPDAIAKPIKGAFSCSTSCDVLSAIL